MIPVFKLCSTIFASSNDNLFANSNNRVTIFISIFTRDQRISLFGFSDFFNAELRSHLKIPYLRIKCFISNVLWNSLNLRTLFSNFYQRLIQNPVKVS